MRVVIRVSISGDQNGLFRNALAGVARDYGFSTEPGRQTTGTWQNHDIDEARYADFLRDYWAVIANPPVGRLDHIWSMCDQWKYPENIDEQIEHRIEELGVRQPGEADQ